MTANVFGEDRAACLAAGKDDHIGKPVDPGLLYTTLVRWLPAMDLAAGEVEVPARAPSESAPEVARLAARLSTIEGVDGTQALHNVGGQPKALERVVRSFVTNYARGMAPAIVAVNAGTSAR